MGNAAMPFQWKRTTRFTVKPQQFLGRNIDHFGNNLGLKGSYIDNMIEETGMTNCIAVTAPGIAFYKPRIEYEALLDREQHKRYRRIVGKPQWLAYTRPDIAYATKEVARDLTAPTELSQKKVNHFLRYSRGTKHYIFTIEPTTTLRANTNNILHLDVHVDSDWAGYPTIRKSTSGFNIIFLGTTVAFGSRTQATIALSSAESELYAICTGVNEGLHLRNDIVVRLHVEQELLLRYLTSGQFIHFTRDYISYMLSIRTTNYLPISQHPQLIYKVDYDMGRFTEIYSLNNNYIWNCRMLCSYLTYFTTSTTANNCRTFNTKQSLQCFAKASATMDSHYSQ